MDWDDAYANAAHIPGAADYPPRWAAEAAAFRARGACEIDIAYGHAPRQRYDLFHPAGAPRGLAVFVHGGYWMRFDKSDWSHLADGARAKGWAVLVPSYTLAPAARIHEITTEIGAAIAAAAGRIAGPIHLAGHSAGGHLVSRMLCKDAPLPDTVAARIAHVTSISGLHDLRPLLHTRMKDTLRLDAAEAAAESPALAAPRDGARITAWVGSAERPEFLRQAELLADSWSRAGADARQVVDPDRHHFDVIEGLADLHSALTRDFVTEG